MPPWLVLLLSNVGSLGVGILLGVFLLASRGAWHDVRNLPKDEPRRRRRSDVEDVRRRALTA